jgi:hypothetical protein
VDVIRLAVVAPVWYFTLDFLGTRKTYGPRRLRAFAVAVAFVAVIYGMFFTVMR